jgi:hypothetical protein
LSAKLSSPRHSEARGQRAPLVILKQARSASLKNLEGKTIRTPDRSPPRTIDADFGELRLSMPPFFRGGYR